MEKISIQFNSDISKDSTETRIAFYTNIGFFIEVAQMFEFNLRKLLCYESSVKEIEKDGLSKESVLQTCQKYDKIYLEPHAIIVVKNGKFGAISYTGKVLANPIYNTYGGSGIESRLLFSNNTQTGEKFIIISKTGVILASKAFTRSQKYSATNWLNNWLKFINSPSWDYRAK